jgi:hypothetical protein
MRGMIWACALCVCITATAMAQDVGPYGSSAMSPANAGYGGYETQTAEELELAMDLVPEPAACCLDLDTCTELEQGICEDQGGVWFPGQECADTDCAVSGCVGATGDCFEPNGTPGCGVFECCETVCSFDDFCCVVEWDDTCAGIAVDLCGFCEPDPTCPGNTLEEAVNIGNLPYTTTDSTCGCCNNYDAVCPFVGSESPETVYRYTAFADITLEIILCDSSYDTKVYVYEEDDDPAGLLGCSDDDCDSPNFNRSYLRQPVETGKTYYIVVDGGRSQCGNYDLVVQEYVPCVQFAPRVPHRAGADLRERLRRYLQRWLRQDPGGLRVDSVQRRSLRCLR